jgi:hypothetical protein
MIISSKDVVALVTYIRVQQCLSLHLTNATGGHRLEVGLAPVEQNGGTLLAFVDRGLDLMGLG